MKKTLSLFAITVITLSVVSTTHSFDLGDVFKEIDKNTPKPPAQSAPKVPEVPKAPDAPAVAPQAPAAQSGGGGLLGLGESMGIVDKKTSTILRQTTQTLQALQPIGEEEEKAIGGALATEVFSKFGGAYDHPPVQRYVTLVGQAVAQLSDRPNIPYHFSIVNSEDPNAFAAPGGYVFVSLGLLRMVQNEAQLAGVLGHEIAHISKKHALQTIQRSKTLQGVSALTLSLMDKDPSMFGKLIDEVSDVLFTRGLDKNLEFEADKVGMEYAYRVGYAPSGLSDFIKILAGSAGGHSVFFSTHPNPRDRFIQLKDTLGQYKSAELNPTLANRYKSETKALP